MSIGVDIAQLGFSVESSQTEIAAERLRALTRAARRAETASQRLSRAADKVGKSMTKMGRGMTLYLTAPLIAFSVASVRAFGNFDDAMVASLAIMGDLSDAIRKDMTVAAKKMGTTTVFSATQAAESYYFLASAGLSARASIAALPKVAAFAQAGNFDMAKATDILTDAQSALGMAMKDPIKNMEEMVALSDVLVKANTIANASVREFGEAIMNKAGVAMKQLNIEVESGVAVLAAWADQAIKGTEAGEKFNIVTRDLQTAYRNNKELFKKEGIAVFDQGEFRNMSDIITDLENALSTLTPELQGNMLAMLGFQDRSVIAIKSLLGLSENIRKYEVALRDAGGITEDVANKQMKSFSKQMGLMKDEIIDVAIELGGTLAPSVIGIAGEVRDLVVAFKELNPETQKMIVKTALLAAALGPLLIVLGIVVRLFGFLIPLIPKLALLITTRLIPALRTLAIFLGPSGAIIIGFTALILLIGNRWVAGIEKGILGTKRYIKSLDELRKAADVLGLQFNLDAVNEQIINNLRMQKELQDTISNVDPGSFKAIGLPEDMAQLERELRHLKDLRIQYESDIDLFSTIEVNVVAIEQLADALNTLGNVELTPDEVEALQDLRDELDPAAKEMRELAAARALLSKAFQATDLDSKEYDKLTAALKKLNPTFNVLTDTLDEFREINAELAAELQDSFDFLVKLDFDIQAEEMQTMIDALEGGTKAWDEYQKMIFQAQAVAQLGPDATDTQIQAIEKLAGTLYDTQQAFNAMSGTLQDWLNVLQGMTGLFHEDSAEAETLRTVMTMLNIVMGVNAVIKQLSQGDVYSAIPRALAVAAMVASMGVRTGATGSSASERSLQESQGAGSVLGDAEAKTESILRANETTADATSELVGINRGMLHALQALQLGLSGAAIRLARGADDTDFGGLPSVLDFNKILGDIPLIGNFLGTIFNKLLGGKTKLLDEGIRIVGGFFNDLTTDVMVQAFQTIKVKKSIFHSSKIKEELQDLGDEMGTQFALVFASIRDTVMEGALALGIPLDIIEERIASFEIATQDISLMDLTGEEVREELLAVFGEIFDDLAAHVIPFIDQFQKVGEGLGETLVRVATSVQVFREAVNALGWSVEGTPEEIAQMAVGLIELTGGIENFISQFTTFFDKFASEEQKLEFATSQLTRAFESVGLIIPNTRDGMVDLMMALDATTESGRAQIAMLLGIASVADEYYDIIESAENERLKQARVFADQVQLISDFTGVSESSALANLRISFKAAMDAADALNATQREYTMITQAFNRQLKRMAAELMLSIMSMVQQLFGSGAAAANPVADGLEQTREVANAVFTEWQRALEDIYDFTQKLLLDESLTTLTPAEQLVEAQSQFDKVLAATQGGDAEAAAELPRAAQALLEEARFMFASGQQYTDIFDTTLSALAGINMPGDIPETITETVGTGEGLLPPQFALVDELITRLERYLLATELAEALRNLSQVLDVSVVQLALNLGVPLRELAAVLGVELSALTDATAAGLADMAALLGADIFELMDVLGVGLLNLARITGVHLDMMSQNLATELGIFATILGVSVFDLAARMDISIADLAETFGIGIDAFSAEQFKALVAFSEALGVGVTEIAEALDINLGSIADATSILSEAMNTTITALPPEIQSELAPYLDAIREATNDADANLAINALGNYILGLPPAIAAPLIPFLEAMGFHHIAPELAAIFDIRKNTRETVVALESLGLGLYELASSIGRVAAATNAASVAMVISIGSLASALTASAAAAAASASSVYTGLGSGAEFVEPIKYDPYKGSFATGGAVDQTGLYQLHAGEFVVNASANNTSPVAANELSTQELKQIQLTLRDIRDQDRRYHEEDLASSQDMKSSLKQQTEQSRRIING